MLQFGQFSHDATFIAAVLASVAALTAAFVAALSTALAPLLQSLTERVVERRRSRLILIEEISDISRHLQANLEILNAIDLAHGRPARMHFDKMKMFETNFLCDNNVVRNFPDRIRLRIIGIRLLVRNLDKEIADLTDRFYAPTVSFGRQHHAEFLDRIAYLRDKFSYAEERLRVECLIIRGRRRHPKMPERSKRIVYMKETA
jgi:hypothetical protein